MTKPPPTARPTLTRSFFLAASRCCRSGFEMTHQRDLPLTLEFCQETKMFVFRQNSLPLAYSNQLRPQSLAACGKQATNRHQPCRLDRCSKKRLKLCLRCFVPFAPVLRRFTNRYAAFALFAACLLRSPNADPGRKTPSSYCIRRSHPLACQKVGPRDVCKTSGVRGPTRVNEQTSWF